MLQLIQFLLHDAVQFVANVCKVAIFSIERNNRIIFQDVHFLDLLEHRHSVVRGYFIKAKASHVPRVSVQIMTPFLYFAA